MLLKNPQCSCPIFYYHKNPILGLPGCGTLCPLYVWETWTFYRRDMKRLERFNQTKLWPILRISWEQSITSNKFLSRRSPHSIEDTIFQHRFCRAGDVSRMRLTRLPRIILLENSPVTRTYTEAKKKPRFKDRLKTCKTLTNIEPVVNAVIESPLFLSYFLSRSHDKNQSLGVPYCGTLRHRARLWKMDL